jgi:hypothetical protein
MNWWAYRKYIGQLIRISTLNLFKRLGKDLLSLRRRSISEVEIDNMRTVDKYRNVFMKIPLMRPLAALYRLLQSPVVFLVLFLQRENCETAQSPSAIDVRVATALVSRLPTKKATQHGRGENLRGTAGPAPSQHSETIFLS